MQRVGQLWKTSGPLADAKAVSERPPDGSVWGDGLVDRSLSSLWYPADWNEVGDDELVFVLPTLSTWQASPTQATVKSGDGPVHYLTRVLAARARAAAEFIAANTPGDAAATPALALEVLVNRGILTAIPLQELTAPMSGSRNEPHVPIAASIDEQHPLPDWLVLELTEIAHLDRMLLDARGMKASSLLDWPLSLADVVLATINARLNGVYVHPEFVCAHELLTAAALLGQLVHGRAVYMPLHLAHCLVDLLSHDEKSGAREEDWCASIVRMYADLAGGHRRTLALAKRAAASGRPPLARPRRPVIPKDMGRTTWNARLFQRIAGRWQF